MSMTTVIMVGMIAISTGVSIHSLVSYYRERQSKRFRIYR